MASTFKPAEIIAVCYVAKFLWFLDAAGTFFECLSLLSMKETELQCDLNDLQYEEHDNVDSNSTGIFDVICKVNNANTRAICETCPKLRIIVNLLIFIINFEQISFRFILDFIFQNKKPMILKLIDESVGFLLFRKQSHGGVLLGKCSYIYC